MMTSTSFLTEMKQTKMLRTLRHEVCFRSSFSTPAIISTLKQGTPVHFSASRTRKMTMKSSHQKYREPSQELIWSCQAVVFSIIRCLQH